MTTAVKEYIDIEDFKGLLKLKSFDSELFESVRKRSIEELNSLSFPTRKNEHWKYTRVGKITSKEWKYGDHLTNREIQKNLIPGWDGTVMVFVNGHYREDLSTVVGAENGIKIKPMSNACENCTVLMKDHYASFTSETNNIFNSIHTSSWTNGFFVYAPEGVTIEKGIHVISIGEGTNSYSPMRNMIILEKGASAHITLSVLGDLKTNSFQHIITEGNVGPNASLDFNKIQISGHEALQMCVEGISQERDSICTINTMVVDTGWTRNDVLVELNDENCETNLYGAYLPVNHQHVDNHTVIDHKKPHCNSNELYKGVVYDSSTGVFNGKVFVRENAQKTNAFQSNNNIVMSESATMNSKPELEIYADDVKCSHGSTTGQFDEEAVFYLRSRGIKEENARRLLVGAFLSDTFDKIHDERVKSFVLDLFEKKQVDIVSRSNG